MPIEIVKEMLDLQATATIDAESDLATFFRNRLRGSFRVEFLEVA